MIADDNNEDISTADSFELRILKPVSGTELVRTDLTASGTKKVLYTLVAGDVDEIGSYRAHVVFIKAPSANIIFPLFIYHVLNKFKGAGQGFQPNTLVQ